MEADNTTYAMEDSFEKNCFSVCMSTLNMGLINKVDIWYP